MNKVLVIMLANSSDGQMRSMTANALETAYNNKGCNIDLHITLVETNPNAVGFYNYDYVNVYCPNESFNYNKFINFGYKVSEGFWPNFFAENNSNKYVMIANNDLVFHEDWATNLVDGIEQNGLDSASPKSPGWQFHHQFTEHSLTGGVFEGWGIGHQFCGWALLYKKESWDKLFPLDERFVFFCQDNDLTIRMDKMEMKHALVVSSFVTHLVSQSHRTIERSEFRHFTDGMCETFHNKVNSGEYDK